jgi:hypothetical protein
MFYYDPYQQFYDPYGGGGYAPTQPYVPYAPQQQFSEAQVRAAFQQRGIANPPPEMVSGWINNLNSGGTWNNFLQQVGTLDPAAFGGTSLRPYDPFGGMAQEHTQSGVPPMPSLSGNNSDIDNWITQVFKASGYTPDAAQVQTWRQYLGGGGNPQAFVQGVANWNPATSGGGIFTPATLQQGGIAPGATAPSGGGYGGPWSFGPTGGGTTTTGGGGGFNWGSLPWDQIIAGAGGIIQGGAAAYGAAQQAQMNRENLAAQQANRAQLLGMISPYMTAPGAQNPYAQALMQFVGGGGGPPQMTPQQFGGQSQQGWQISGEPTKIGNWDLTPLHARSPEGPSDVNPWIPTAPGTGAPPQFTPAPPMTPAGPGGMGQMWRYQPQNAFTYNPSALGAAPQVGAGSYNAMQLGAAPQASAMALSAPGGFMPQQVGGQQVNAQNVQSALAGRAPDAQAGAFGASLLGAAPQMQGAQFGAVPQIGGIPGVSAQNIQSPGTMFAPTVGTSQFNAGQDGLLQMMRRDLGRAVDPELSRNLEQIGAGGTLFDNSDVFRSLGALDQRQINEQVGQLQGSAGSLGERYGTALATNEANLRRDALQNLQARNAQLASGSWEQMQARRLQAAGLMAGREQEANAFTLGAAGQQLQAAQAAAGIGVQQRGLTSAEQQANAGYMMQAQGTNIAANMQGQIANQAAQLQAQGMNQQQAWQIASQNAQAQMTALGQNAGFAQQAGLANQQAGLQYGLANQAAQQQAGQFNAQQFGQTSQFNAAQQQALALANAQMQNQVGMGNQAAQLQAAQATAGFGMQAGLANQQAGLQAGMQNQDIIARIMQANQQSQLAASLANQQAGVQYGLANQGAFNQGQQFNIQSALQAALANQQMQGQYGLANQAAFNQAGQFNAAQQQAMHAFQAQQGNQYNQNIFQALSQAQAMQQAQQQQNMGWAGLMAGVPVPQAQPSPWPGAIGDIGQLMMMPWLFNQMRQ